MIVTLASCSDIKSTFLGIRTANIGAFTLLGSCGRYRELVGVWPRGGRGRNSWVRSVVLGEWSLLTPSFINMSNSTGFPEPSYLCGFGDWAVS